MDHRSGTIAAGTEGLGTHVLTRISNSVEETEQIAAEIAQTLRGGECIALYGELGAGKTQFVRGLVRGLGGNPRAVSSPTFVLLNTYDGGRLKVFHLDAYRIGGVADFETIGFAEMLEQGGVVVVEWPGKIEKLLPGNRVNVKISARSELTRVFEIK